MQRFMKVIAAIMLSVTAMLSVGCKNYNVHEYVDLGLPSGTLWATCNVGASTPEDYGNYYAWGETSTKSTYDWSTYKYANGAYDKLTKYCNEGKYGNYGNNGFTDNLTSLELSDDAATANWGSGWRMPAIEEWKELIANTTSTWTTQNGVTGWLFIATNGNELFLPAAGIRWDGDLDEAGFRGLYWSRSLYTGSPYTAYSLYFTSDGCYVDYLYRFGGFSVRPVRKN